MTHGRCTVAVSLIGVESDRLCDMLGVLVRIEGNVGCRQEIRALGYVEHER